MTVPTIKSALRMSLAKASHFSAWSRFIRRIGATQPSRLSIHKCKTRLSKLSLSTSLLLQSENTEIPYSYATAPKLLSLWPERRELPDY